MQIIEISEPNSIQKLNHKPDIAVGIDFGTTNSLIAVSKNQLPRIIKDIKGRELVPSFYLIPSVKRLLGKSFQEISTTPILQSIVKDFIDENSTITPKIKFYDKSLTLPVVASEIFKYLKLQAERDLGQPVTKAVVTVPAYFDDAAKGSVMLAAKIAGFEVLRLIAEPTAAAYAYGLNKNIKGCYLVYDLGGGTFDVSILNMQDGVFQVVATTGDNMLGGDDIDYLVLEYFQKKNASKLMQSIDLAKKAKEALTYADSFYEGDFNINIETFDQLIRPLIQRTIDLTKDAIDNIANLNLDGIILVGGSTRIPLITKELRKNFNTPIFSDLDPDKVVALGAALQAENLTSLNPNSLLIDVVPLSLGIELYGGIVEKIISRNSPIPLSVTKEFTTYSDNQTAMDLHIVQGEREMVKDCRSLARFELKDIPPMKSGAARIEITFSVDTDGILSVSTLEKLTNKSQIIQIKPTYGLDQVQINEILKDAYSNASLDHHNRLLQEARIEANSLIQSIENAIQEMPDILPKITIDEINAVLIELKDVITLNDRDLIIDQITKLNRSTEDFLAARLNRTIGDLLEGKNIKDVR